MNNQSTVFHVTHYKAGSQWVRAVLSHCAPERIVQPEPRVAHFFDQPIRPGGIYPTVYVSKLEFDQVMSHRTRFAAPSIKGEISRPRSLMAANLVNFRILRQPHKKFVVIRDLRDTLVSLYFSAKFSHPVINELVERRRGRLHSMDEDQGLMMLMDRDIPQNAGIQTSRIDSGTLVIKYEDLLSDEYAAFEHIVDYCGISVDRQRLHQVIYNNSFEVISGRQPGQEDVNAHQRKGIAGDWRNYFSHKVKEEFKKRFGDVLIKTGYEKDLKW